MQSKEELFAVFGGKPVEVELDGKKIHLLPLTYGSFLELDKMTDAESKAQFVTLRCLCDPSGKRLLTDDDGAYLQQFPLTFTKAVFDEISTRLKGNEPGKAPSPTTTN